MYVFWWVFMVCERSRVDILMVEVIFISYQQVEIIAIESSMKEDNYDRMIRVNFRMIYVWNKRINDQVKRV